jgi:hypothetical protein
MVVPLGQETLQRLLVFMSDDTMRLEFSAGAQPDGASEYLDFGADTDEVALFSGGLDSLTGAVDRLSTGSARLLLVSHQSSTKIAKPQRETRVVSPVMV